MLPSRTRRTRLSISGGLSSRSVRPLNRWTTTRSRRWSRDAAAQREHVSATEGQDHAGNCAKMCCSTAVGRSAIVVVVEVHATTSIESRRGDVPNSGWSRCLALMVSASERNNATTVSACTSAMSTGRSRSAAGIESRSALTVGVACVISIVAATTNVLRCEGRSTGIECCRARFIVRGLAFREPTSRNSNNGGNISR